MRSLLLLFILLFILLLSCGKGQTPYDNSNTTPSRIISFAPSITEILYELGLGENIAGVTLFCKYPTAAVGKEKIGAHASFNYEAIIRLKPDLAVILKEQRGLAEFFDRYGIRYITVGNDSADEVLESIGKIADSCFVKERGGHIIRHLRERMDSVALSVRSTLLTAGRPKVLLCVDREGIGSGVVSKCFAAGASSFYDQLITLSGGVNVLSDVRQPYPSVGAEAVTRLDPDVIIDISSAYSSRGNDSACDDWAAFKNLSAVKNKRVHCLSGDYLTIPGPRFLLILDDLKKCFDYEST